MPLTIHTNIIALNAQRNLSSSQSALSSSMQRLSSGLRVNTAKDDAAGLAIAERMNAQVRGMNVAARNANDGISLAQTAEGALGKVSESLQRMRELAVQSANASNSDSDKDSLDKEFGELSKEIQRVLGGTTFNGLAVLGGDAGTQLFQYRRTGVAVVNRRFDDTWGYRVDTDCVTHKFLGQGPGQGRNESLAGGIQTRAQAASAARSLRGHVDDAAASALLAHAWHDIPAEGEHGACIEVEYAVHQRVAGIHQWRALNKAAGVVDQYIDPAKVLPDLGGQAIQLGRVRHVGMKYRAVPSALPHLRQHRLSLRGMRMVVHGNPCAISTEANRRCSANAGTGSGDQYHLVLQILHVCFRSDKNQSICFVGPLQRGWGRCNTHCGFNRTPKPGWSSAEAFMRPCTGTGSSSNSGVNMGTT